MRKMVTLVWFIVLSCWAFLPPSVFAQAVQEEEDPSLRASTPEGQEASENLATISHADKDHRELRQSIFCRCVADYEDFYELDTGRDRRLSLSTYYNPWPEEEEEGDTTTRTGTQKADSKYYTTEYRQYSARPGDDITVGSDGWVIVNGITVLPLSNEACIASQTNAALRAFLTVFYGPNANRSAESFWALIQAGGRRLGFLKGSRGLKDTDKDGDQELPTMLRSGGRKLAFAGWEAKRNRARRRRHRTPTIWEQDLSEGTEYERRQVPRVFPCPPDAAVPANPTPAPTPSPSTSNVPSVVPTSSQMPSNEPSEVPSFEPSISNPPSGSPLGPTISPGPTATPGPTTAGNTTVSPVPSISSGPSVSLEPTGGNVTTISPGPTISVGPTVSPEPMGSNATTVSPVPTISSAPTATLGPTALPTLSPGPSITPEPSASQVPSSVTMESIIPGPTAVKDLPTAMPQVNIVEGPPIPDNDTCEAANLIVVDNAVFRVGNTVAATRGPNRGCASSEGLDNVSKGVWYTVVGNGNDFKVSTCFLGTGFNTSIQVFSGSCANLQCVRGAGADCDHDCASPKATAVSFSTEFGVSYYFLVFGRTRNDEGTFFLSVYEA